MVGNLVEFPAHRTAEGRARSVQIHASISAIMAPDSPRDRDLAEWNAARDVAEHPRDYAPKAFVSPLASQVERWFSLDHEGLVTTAQTNPTVFGAYRIEVLDYEGRCAKQLEALVWAYNTLFTLSQKPGAKTERIMEACQPIADMLQQDWRVQADFLKVSKLRGWTSKQTRRYDLLPVSWRYL